MSGMPADPFTPEPDPPGWPPGLGAGIQTAQAIFMQLIELDDIGQILVAVDRLDEDTIRRIVLARACAGHYYLRHGVPE